MTHFLKQNAFFIILLLCIITLIIVVCIQGSLIRQNRILLDNEVGISEILRLREDIVSASFYSFDPNYNYEFEDVNALYDVIATLESAVFTPAKAPKVIFSSESINLEAKNKSYSVGVTDGLIRIHIDGETNYYRCSARVEFQKALFELQGR